MYTNHAVRKIIDTARYLRDSPFALGLVFLFWAASFPVWESIFIFLFLVREYVNIDYIPYPIPMGLRWGIYLLFGGALTLTSHHHAIHGHYGRWTLHTLFVILGILLAIFIMVFVFLLSSITVMQMDLLWAGFLRDFTGSLGFKG